MPCSEFIVFLEMPAGVVRKVLYVHTYDELRGNPFGNWKLDHRTHDQTMVVKCYTRATGIATSSFGLFLFIELYKMEPKTSGYLAPRGAAPVVTATRIKSADLSYSIFGESFASKWPSILVENGFSDLQLFLDDNARWWLETSGGKVRKALTLSIQR